MKHAILLAISASLLASTTLAGSSEPPVYPVTQITPPAAATDWSGFYAGGMVSFDSAGILQLYSTDTGLPGTNTTVYNITSFGGFTGYNFQNGAFVYGGEFAVLSGGLTASFDPAINYDAVFDLKARAGYSFGPAMVYGVVGGSFSNLNWGAAANYPSTGLNYGAGVEYKIGQQLFVGIEYLVRNLEGMADVTPWEARITTQSAQLRVGWKF